MTFLPRTATRCRLCNSAALQRVLSLPSTPPANAFRVGECARETYPLDLYLCGACGHLQLGIVLDPQVLYPDYLYVSGTSPSFVQHFRDYADAVIEKRRLRGRFEDATNPDRFYPGDLVVEIGSNDGTGLLPYRSHGLPLLGVEPAEKIAAVARSAGIPTVTGFFDESFDLWEAWKASGQDTRLLAAVRCTGCSRFFEPPYVAPGDSAICTFCQREQVWGGPKAKVVLANNVMAHIDDLAGVLKGVQNILDPDGVFIFEVQGLLEMVEQGYFDNCYHEHLSYHTALSLMPFFEQHSDTRLFLYDVEEVSTHGGSIRCWARFGGSRDGRVHRRAARERAAGLDRATTYHKLQDGIDRLRVAYRALRDQHPGRWVGYGAPAKSTTLLHLLQEKDLAYVVDDSAWKQGRLTPGTGFPVVAPQRLLVERPDVVLVLAWNFKDQIVDKVTRLFAPEREKTPRFVIPLPTPVVLP